MIISYRFKYWVFNAVYLALSYFLIQFNTTLLNGWNNPQVISSIDWINGRLGEIVGFGISVVFVIYVVCALILLIINVNKFGVQNINYKALTRLHSVVFTALIFYLLIFAAFFVRF